MNGSLPRRPPPDATPFDGEQTFLGLLPTIDRITRAVSRRHHLSAADAEEFASIVRLRLLDNNYAVLRRFQGRSSVQSFLTVVIGRQCLDYRIAQWGKWRPSARARRLGPTAMRLEAMVARDRVPFHEALASLDGQRDTCVDDQRLWTLFLKLPTRRTRRVCSGYDFDQLETDVPDPHEVFTRAEARRMLVVLQRALATLDPGDWQIIVWRFWDHRSVAEIARRNGLDQRQLYRRVSRILAELRAELETRGVARDDIAGWTGC